MKFASKALLLGALLLLAASAAYAAPPAVVAIPDLSINADGTATVYVVAYDPDGDGITLTSSLPAWATLNAPLTGTGLVSTTITLHPTAADVGTVNGTITATAGGETTTETFAITVNAAGSNQAPAVLAPSFYTVSEGQAVTFVVTASDANGDAITTLTAAPLPSGATFNTNASHTSGTFTWTPSTSQAGLYDVTFTASNGLSGSATTHLVVLDSAGGNECPVFSLPVTIGVSEGQAVNFSVSVTDVDNDAVTLTAQALPTGATFTDNNNNSGSFAWTPGSTQSGTYTIVFTANDNHGCIQVATVTITVSEPGGANQCPVLTLSQNTLTVNEGQAFSFNVSASDPDGGTVDLSASGLPSGSTFVDHDNSTGTLSWTPGSTQSGTYMVTFIANDNEGCTQTAMLTVTVNDVTGGNQCPTITAPATWTVNEGQMVTFTVTTTDPNGDLVTLAASGVPSGATFNTGSGTFTWTPGSSQSGTYTVTFTANDNHGCTQTATTVITVNDVGGGGGTDARATLLGAYNSHKKQLCFRIEPVNGGFDVRNVDRTTIALSWNGTTIDPSRTSLDWECDDDGDHDGDCGDWNNDCENDDDDDECGECEDHEDECPSDTTGCTASLKACFSMTSLRGLFGDASIPENLDDVVITGDLSTGGTFTATLRPIKVAGNHGDKGNHKLRARATPNPLNPTTKLTFTLTKPGRVRVSVYDARGRYVKTLLDASRSAGEQSLLWDGSDARSRKVSSGVYLFRIQAVEGEDIQRVTVLK